MFNLVQVYFLSFPSSFQIFGTIFSSSEEKAIVSRTEKSLNFASLTSQKTEVGSEIEKNSRIRFILC